MAKNKVHIETDALELKLMFESLVSDRYEDLNIEFHDTLNPLLWRNKKLLPEVRSKLLKIAADFRDSLGIKDLDIQDIIFTGSNAAYSYTPISDIDLHLVVDIPKADTDNIYRELFDAKKYQYNAQHDFKIKGYDVELYVEQLSQPAFSLGVYSILNDEWVKQPTRQRANFDVAETRVKYHRIRKLIDLAVRARDQHLANKLRAAIKKYRQAGLEATGEFGPENLAFKALRADGDIKRLFDLITDLKNEEMSLESVTDSQLVFTEGAVPDNRVVTKIKELLGKPLLTSDLKAQMEAYFIVPDPTMLKDFRLIRAQTNDNYDLRETFKSYLAAQMHPDVLNIFKISPVNVPAYDTGLVIENTAGAFAAVAMPMGGMIRRPQIVKKRKSKKHK